MNKSSLDRNHCKNSLSSLLRFAELARPAASTCGGDAEGARALGTEAAFEDHGGEDEEEFRAL